MSQLKMVMEEHIMSDFFQNVSEDQNIFQKLLGKIPGFNGYMEREKRRASDKLMRESIANRFEQLWGRISGLQRDLISQGGIAYIDDMEAAAIKLRQFIDRIRTAAYGYSPFFAAAKVNEQELAQVYEFDLAMFTMGDEVNRAIDNVEASLGTEGLPAAIRNLTTLSRQCVDVFEKRHEIMIGSGTPQASQ